MTEELNLEEIEAREWPWWCEDDAKALIAEVRKLREENEELENRCTLITTMMKCATCDRGVKAMYAVCGMCPECARKEIEALRELQKRANKILSEIISELPKVSDE